MTSAAARAASSAACSSLDAMTGLLLPVLVRAMAAPVAAAVAAPQVIGSGKYHAPVLEVEIPVLQRQRPRRPRLRFRLRLECIVSLGSHAAFLAVSIPASRTRYALLGGISPYDDSFPHMEVRHLDPIRIFRAALTSRSCNAPQLPHTQNLTINPLTPRGPVRAPQAEQVTLVFLSLATSNVLAACWLLYSRKPLSMPQLESSTDLAIRVLTSCRLLTSPTTIF